MVFWFLNVLWVKFSAQFVIPTKTLNCVLKNLCINRFSRLVNKNQNFPKLSVGKSIAALAVWSIAKSRWSVKPFARWIKERGTQFTPRQQTTHIQTHAAHSWTQIYAAVSESLSNWKWERRGAARAWHGGAAYWFLRFCPATKIGATPLAPLFAVTK